VVVLVLSLLVGTFGCSDPATPDTPGQARIGWDDVAIALEVTSCTLVGGRFPDQPPPGRTEALVYARGTDAAGVEVTVVARWSAEERSADRIETVEITVGDVTDEIRALVLYRAYDAAARRWTEIDPDVPSARVEVPGPLFVLDGAELRAAGTTVLPEDGRRTLARLHVRCPVTSDEPDGLLARSSVTTLTRTG
jgi:hypothetical protein